MKPEPKTPTIDQIECELLELSGNEERRWQRVAELLMLAEEKSLWTPHAKSFTQWVKKLAEQAGVQESNFWRALKAGQTYLKFRRAREAEAEQAEAADADNVTPITDDTHPAPLPPLAEANVAAENLELLEKISRVAPDLVIAEATEKTLSGRMSRADLRSIWATYRNATEGTARGRGGCGKTTVDDSQLTAAVILDLLRTDDAGQMVKVLLFEEHREEQATGRASRGQEYACLPEFAVYTGTTRKARRMDAMLVSNDIRTLVGVEIKVSRHDLENDQKFTEYQPYCNALYLAVPKGLEQVALDTAPESVGVLAIQPTSRVMEVPRTAETREIEPFFALETLRRLALRWYRK